MYVLPFFIKPGKHQYMIKYKNTKERNQKKALKKLENNLKAGREENLQAPQPEIFIYECEAIQREEAVPEFAKPMHATIV